MLNSDIVPYYRAELLGRICAGAKPLMGQTEERPVIGIDIIDLQVKDSNENIDDFKRQISFDEMYHLFHFPDRLEDHLSVVCF
jgi:hypothetical protein